MNPEDEEAALNQLKPPQIAVEALPRTGYDFIRAVETRRLGNRKQPNTLAYQVQAYAEDEFVRKEYTELRCEMPGTPRSTFLMVFSPDGTKVASTHGNHNIYVTDLRNGKNIKTLVGHPRTPWCIAFHPTCNELVASGCLGGQVRIWDLSGGSEVWTTSSQTVIASIAFHPRDRVLVIATYNELYFWDWSMPEPFARQATNNAKEKVRYVSFDRLGHKLITGIANTPHSRWERARASVPAPERTAPQSQRPPRPSVPTSSTQVATTSANVADRSPLSSVPERERRITACYRNLVQEYELLVHRYLQVYRPPATIDRGTDPMETEQQQQQQQRRQQAAPRHPQPKRQMQTAEVQTTPDLIPRTRPNPPSSVSPPEAPSTTSTSCNHGPVTRFRLLISNGDPSTTSTSQQTCSAASQTSAGPTTSTNAQPTATTTDKERTSKMRIKCAPRRRRNSTTEVFQNSNLQILKRRIKLMHKNLTQTCTEVKGMASKMRDDAVARGGGSTSTASEGAAKRASANRRDGSTNTTASNATTTEPMPGTSGTARKKRVYPGFAKKGNRRHVPDETSSDNSSSDDDDDDDEELKKRLLHPLPTASALNSSASSAFARPTAATTTTSTPPPNNLEMLADVMEAVSNNNRPTNAAQPQEAGDGADMRTASAPPPPPTRGGRSLIVSHILSAFLPTRPTTEANGTPPRTATPEPPPPPPPPFPVDEVVDYARAATEEQDEQPINLSEFHPFNPPPEIPTIHPENIGIGNMYSNIVQDLESSLNNVRNIRASSRPGETSDMLSSFSERLESIMHQSESILHNLRHSMDMLPANGDQRGEQAPRLLRASVNSEPRQPRVLFNVPNFYVRDPHDADAYNSSRSAIAFDHTYPMSAGSARADAATASTTAAAAAAPPPDNLTPLMTSLHFTISHIQRQASLLRQQVESIERIDRAMLEVAQIQMMRQMFVEIRGILSRSEMDERSPSGVSSVRQMMAGTRISDSSPYDSAAEDELAAQPPSTSAPSTNTSPAPPNPPPPPPPPRAGVITRSASRRTFTLPRLPNLQRPQRRFAVVQRNIARDRTTRRRMYFRAFSIRPTGSRAPPTPNRAPFLRANLPCSMQVNVPSLVGMNVRLEKLLTQHIRLIRYPPAQQVRIRPGNGNEMREAGIDARLNGSRQRLNAYLGRATNYGVANNYRVDTNGATAETIMRYNARDTLSVILDALTCYLEDNGVAHMPPNLRFQVRNLLDLTSLLSDILLLEIVATIPPPTGMNLDPERESLSLRIDQTCSWILQNRLNGQSQNLTRSLRLMRLTARYASRALGHTYNVRRNAIFSGGNNSRRQLLGQISRTIRHMSRQRARAMQSQSEAQRRQAALPMGEWYQTINELVTRYQAETEAGEQPSGGGGGGGGGGAAGDSGGGGDGNAAAGGSSGVFVVDGNNSDEDEELRFESARRAVDAQRAEARTGMGPPFRIPIRLQQVGGVGTRWLIPSNRLFSSARAPSSMRSFLNAGESPFNEDTEDEDEMVPSRSAPRDRSLIYRTGPTTVLRGDDDEAGVEGASTSSSTSSTNNNGGNRAWNVPTVQINDVPLSESPTAWHSRLVNQLRQQHQQRTRLAEMLPRSPVVNLFRPRFLHPLYAGVNPFESDLDDPQHRDHILDGGEMITTVTPNHRIQLWDISLGNLPDISNSLKNIVVAECKIHNDASVDISNDGTILVTLLPSGGYLNVTNRLGVYSLRWETLGQCLYLTNFEQNAVSVSLSPLSRHLVVGLASRRVSMVPNDKWTMARVFLLNTNDENEARYGSHLPVLRELEQNRDMSYMSLNCIRWLPISGQGFIYATNTGQLRILS